MGREALEAIPRLFRRFDHFLAGISPNGENFTDQMYSCPRDWRLLASWGSIEGPLKPLEHYSIYGAEGGLQLGPHDRPPL